MKGIKNIRLDRVSEEELKTIQERVGFSYEEGGDWDTGEYTFLRIFYSDITMSIHGTSYHKDDTDLENLISALEREVIKGKNAKKLLKRLKEEIIILDKEISKDDD